MRSMSVNVYKADELSDSAQSEAHINWTADGYGWHSDNEKALEEFAKIFPVKITGWEYGGQYAHVTFELESQFEYDDNPDMAPQRLATYIYNNYYNDIVKGKYFSLWSKTEKSERNPSVGKLKSRHSKVMFESCCPLTGYCVDEDLLQPIFEFLKKPYDTTLNDLMNKCLQAWAKSCDDDFNGSLTLEAFLDSAEANDYEFYEDGRMV